MTILIPGPETGVRASARLSDFCWGDGGDLGVPLALEFGYLVFHRPLPFDRRRHLLAQSGPHLGPGVLLQEADGLHAADPDGHAEDEGDGFLDPFLDWGLPMRGQGRIFVHLVHRTVDQVVQKPGGGPTPSMPSSGLLAGAVLHGLITQEAADVRREDRSLLDGSSRRDESLQVVWILDGVFQVDGGVPGFPGEDRDRGGGV